MVPNLVVGIEIYHFSLFEYNSRFAIIIAKGKWSIHGFKTVLKTGLNCDVVSRVAEVAREHGWHPPKVWTWTKILSPKIRYFVVN